jgi:ribose 5-phosphate isomerase B
MKISIGADHRGYALKQVIINHFGEHQFVDAGTFNQERTDYPLFAQKVCNDIRDGQAEVGILICGSGVGMSIAANRHKKIYAGLCWSPEVARVAKAHDGINVLVLPADFVTSEVAIQIMTTWLATPFEGGRYAQRLEMTDK